MSDKDKKLLILGNRTLAVEIMDLISEIRGLNAVGFVENMHPERCKEKLEGLPIYWVDDLRDFAKTHYAVFGLATTHRKRFVEQAIACGIPFTTIIHPSAQISKNSLVGDGTIISRGSIIATHTQLGKHVLVNRGVLIGHHSEIGDYVTVHPGANIAGTCIIGDGSYVGMGAVIIDHLTIGKHSVIGAGAVVTNDVPDNVQVVGVPARIVKENIKGK